MSSTLNYIISTENETICVFWGVQGAVNFGLRMQTRNISGARGFENRNLLGQIWQAMQFQTYRQKPQFSQNEGHKDTF